jgi:hypothetical protein
LGQQHNLLHVLGKNHRKPDEFSRLPPLEIRPFSPWWTFLQMRVFA